jgi:hypothetical protein
MSTPISHAEMHALGWERTDPRPWSKVHARWKHTSGWLLAHCGHPTANHPWALVRPDGHMVCTGVRWGNPPNFGTAWPNLREPAEWLAEHLRSGADLGPEVGPVHIWSPWGVQG